jgi:hypothetical protein
VQSDSKLYFLIFWFKWFESIETEWFWNLIVFWIKLINKEKYFSKFINNIADLINEIASSIDETAFFVMKTTLLLNK